MPSKTSEPYRDPDTWERENKRAFVLLVQTIALSMLIAGRCNMGFPGSAVYAALRCRSTAVPTNIAKAAAELIEHLSKKDEPPPWWETVLPGLVDESIPGY